MRAETAELGARSGELVLDLGSGPGQMATLIEQRGGAPVLVDASERMLRISRHPNRVRAAFENLPFKRGSFASAVSGFAIRDSRDLVRALFEVREVLAPGGQLVFCDIGRPRDPLRFLMIALYIRIFSPLIGLATAGPKGLKFGSLYQTYMLTLNNEELMKLLGSFFAEVRLRVRQFGGSIVVSCTRGA